MEFIDLEVGIGGHYGVTEGASHKIINQLKKAQQELSGCPINYKAPTCMTEETFRRTCIAFQKRAGLVTKKCAEDAQNRHSDIVGGFFRSKNKSLCSKCKIGMSVRGNRRLRDLPTGITIDSTIMQPTVYHEVKRRILD